MLSGTAFAVGICTAVGLLPLSESRLVEPFGFCIVVQLAADSTGRVHLGICANKS